MEETEGPCLVGNAGVEAGVALFNWMRLAIRLSIKGSLTTVTIPFVWALIPTAKQHDRQVSSNFISSGLKKKNAEFFLQKSAFYMGITNYNPAP